MIFDVEDEDVVHEEEPEVSMVDVLERVVFLLALGGAIAFMVLLT